MRSGYPMMFVWPVWRLLGTCYFPFRNFSLVSHAIMCFNDLPLLQVSAFSRCWAIICLLFSTCPILPNHSDFYVIVRGTLGVFSRHASGVWLTVQVKQYRIYDAIRITQAIQYILSLQTLNSNTHTFAALRIFCTVFNHC